MKTTIRYTEVKDQELERAEIDKMVGSMVLDLCNILLNENIVQHRDEARVLLHEIFKNRSEMDKLIADKAKALLDSGLVRFVYDSGYYKDKGIVIGGKSMEWLQTDELQYVKKKNDDLFEIVDVATHLEDGYYVKHIMVDFNNISEKEIQDGISGFYDSLDIVKETYDNDWKQIVAECIAENEPIDNQVVFFDGKIKLEKYLFKKFGIVSE